MLEMWLLFFIFIALFEIALLIYVAERWYSVRIKHQYPPVSCRARHACALVADIRKNYPNAKTVVDIGAGFGRLARAIANGTGANVYAIENMPVSVRIAKFMKFITRARRIGIVYADAFEYIPGKKFDIGIAYLGPDMNARLRDLMPCFRVMITLDAEIPGIRPTRIIDIPGGYTYYHHIGRFPNRLYIYENPTK